MIIGASILPTSLDEIRGWARIAEDGGFDYFTLADSQSFCFDVYVGLTLAALETKRVGLGTTVTNPLTRHPVVTIGASASIDHLSGGRTFIGVGSGDSSVFSIGVPPAKVGDLRAFLIAARALMRGERADYLGRTIHTRWVTRPMPLVLAAAGPKTLQLAGELADVALINTGLTPELVEIARSHVRAGERAAGRPVGSVPLWAFAHCRIADTREEAIEQVKGPLTSSARHVFRGGLDGKGIPAALRDRIAQYQEEYDHAGHWSEGRNLTLAKELGVQDYFVERFAIIGTPQECLAKTRALERQGLDGIFLAMGVHQRIVLERFSREVIGPLRGAAGR